MPSVFFPRSLRLSSVFAALLALPALAQDIDIGKQAVRPDLETIPVVLRSESEEARRLLQTAVAAHGGYRRAPSMERASYAIAIEPLGASGARLSVSSGIPEQTLHAETVAGASRRQAILRAIDKAILRTSGRPGFFAGRLAFVAERSGAPEIYVGDFLFGEVAQLTRDGAQAVRPRWSPDGRRIVYTSYLSGFPDIYELDLEANARRPLVSFEGTNMGARFSPDGSRLAMILTGEGSADLWVGNAQARQLRRVAATEGLEAAPCWSPEGSRLAVASDMSGGVQLYLAAAEGGPLRRIRTDISGYCSEPDWSAADPNKLLFTAAMGEGYQIAVYDFQRGESQWMTSESGDAIEGHWLPDGRHFLYTVRRPNSKRIALFDTVTRRRTILSPDYLGAVSQASYLPR